MRDRFIFKILTPAQWRNFQLNEQFLGSPVDLEDGYIHMSRASQLKATLDKWYADHQHVTILEVDSQLINTGLKYEISRGGAEFPHLFAALPLKAIGNIWEISAKDRQYSLPSDLKAN